MNAYETSAWLESFRQLRALGLALDASAQRTFGEVRFTQERAGSLAEALLEAGAPAAPITERAMYTVSDAISFMRHFDGVASVALYVDGGKGTSGGWLIASIERTDDASELRERFEQFVADVSVYLEASTIQPVMPLAGSTGLST